MKHLNLILLILLLISCQDKKRDVIAQLVSEWQGKEIIFPKNMVFTTLGTDTVNYKIPTNADYKVLIYVDSIGCTSCKLQLQRWKELITYTDSITGKTLPYLFFFHSKDFNEIKYLLKINDFNYPVCLDKENILDQKNKFPSNLIFQTFLLNKDNKIIIIGNPIHNLSIKDLFLKQIGYLPQKEQPLTSAKVNNTEINIGEILLGESKEVIFFVENTGNSPLVIIDTTTSCECALPTFDRHSAKPGETLNIYIKIRPKDKGFINETFTVKCNTDKIFKLKIAGNTI